MKGFNIPEFLRALFFMKVSAFALISFALIYLGRHYSDGYPTAHLLQLPPAKPSYCSNPICSSFSQRQQNVHSCFYHINQTLETTNPPLLPTLTLPPPPPPAAVDKTGILDETGTMSEEFEVGEFDPELIKSLGNLSRQDGRGDDGNGGGRGDMSCCNKRRCLHLSRISLETGCCNKGMSTEQVP
uniref:Uncharacterized protein n=1 Tax=Nelumbo nucifera TaxID=4432 RepID=A0A822Y5C4_NELNU|nr:TPA_asm: hypothetical protein HUJ06_029125 [Nelumbo nucifera]